MLPGLESAATLLASKPLGAGVVVVGMALGVTLMLGLDAFIPVEDHGLSSSSSTGPSVVQGAGGAGHRPQCRRSASLGADHGDPQCVDRLSSRYLIAVAARLVREVADLARRAEAAKARWRRLTIDTEIRFRSGRAGRAHRRCRPRSPRQASHYHDERANGGRWFRLVVAAHPTTKEVSR